MTARVRVSYAAIGFLRFVHALGAEQVVVCCSMNECVCRSVAKRFEEESGTTVKLVSASD
jgi:hypothetical protein